MMVVMMVVMMVMVVVVMLGCWLKMIWFCEEDQKQVV